MSTHIKDGYKINRRELFRNLIEKEPSLKNPDKKLEPNSKFKVALWVKPAKEIRKRKKNEESPSFIKYNSSENKVSHTYQHEKTTNN